MSTGLPAKAGIPVWGHGEHRSRPSVLARLLGSVLVVARREWLDVYIPALVLRGALRVLTDLPWGHEP